jgi:hypothetical protein
MGYLIGMYLVICALAGGIGVVFYIFGGDRWS